VWRWHAIAPRDVDEMHHGAAQDVAERIGVVRQDDLHHFRAESEERLGVRSTVNYLNLDSTCLKYAVDRGVVGPSRVSTPRRCQSTS